MNFFKRALALALATCTLCSAGVMASAADVDMDDEAPYVNEDGVEIAFTVETDDLGTLEITQAEVDEAAKLVQELIDGGAIEVPDEYTPMPIYGTVLTDPWTSTDYATYLAGKDGLTNARLINIKAYGKAADRLARKKASSLPGDLEDACRHFTWNLLAADDSTIGASRIKTFSNAYEWAYLCSDEIIPRYNTRLTYWRNQGASDFETKAFTDACVTLKSVRDARVKEIKNGSYTTFKKYVDKDSAMDFWNNQKGRDYAKMGQDLSSDNKIYSVFTDARNNHDIIGYKVDAKPGTDTHRTVYKNTSWWS